MQESTHFGHRLLEAGSESSDTPPQFDEGIESNRKHQKCENRQLRNLVENNEYQADEGKGAPDGSGDGGCKHGTHDTDIIGNPRHQFSGFFPLKKRQRHTLNMIVEPLTQLSDRVVTDKAQDKIFAVSAYTFYDKDDEHKNRQENEEKSCRLYYTKIYMESHIATHGPFHAELQESDPKVRLLTLYIQAA